MSGKDDNAIHFSCAPLAAELQLLH